MAVRSLNLIAPCPEIKTVNIAPGIRVTTPGRGHLVMASIGASCEVPTRSFMPALWMGSLRDGAEECALPRPYRRARPGFLRRDMQTPSGRHCVEASTHQRSASDEVFFRLRSGYVD